MATKVSNLTISLQAGTSRTYYAAWDFVNAHLDKYLTHWYYSTGQGIWFDGGSSQINIRNSTYTAPNNATAVKFNVKPLSTTYKVNGKDTTYFTGTTVSATKTIGTLTPAKPSTPTITLNGYKVKAELTGISDVNTNFIRFEIYKDNTFWHSSNGYVRNGSASALWTIAPGHTYKVRARGHHYDSVVRNGSEIVGKKPLITGSWCDNWSSTIIPKPAAPKKINSVKAASATSVTVNWGLGKGADSYKIQYAIDKRYFNSNPSEVSTVSGITTTTGIITGLETGQAYYFRVCSVNTTGESGYTEIEKIILGEAPGAPTTWSNTTTAIIGDTLTLNAKHNSFDGSIWTTAEIDYKLNGASSWTTVTINNSDTSIDSVITYTLSTSGYNDGDAITWRARTKGVIDTWSEYSVIREIKVYAEPSISITASATVTSFPIDITLEAAPNTQTPVSYFLSVISNDYYETNTQTGRKRVVLEGEEIFSREYVSNEDELILQLTPEMIALENDIDYTIVATVVMDTNLLATNTTDFETSWEDDIYDIDTTMTLDDDTWSIYLHPYCLDDEENYVNNVTLSVYRRDYDGSFTLIEDEIVNEEGVYITDPHPALDYARYRIVATSDTTGTMSFYDTPDFPVDCKSIIIQWDDEYDTYFETEESQDFEEPVLRGSMLVLPYNITISENNQPDVKNVQYIGRSHPVSYYGTQIGQKAIWECDIPKNDTDTLFNLRRLSTYMGDSYVREPSGSGYWAHIEVAIGQTYDTQTVPVTLNITRVEGGV